MGRWIWIKEPITWKASKREKERLFLLLLMLLLEDLIFLQSNMLSITIIPQIIKYLCIEVVELLELNNKVTL